MEKGECIELFKAISYVLALGLVAGCGMLIFGRRRSDRTGLNILMLSRDNTRVLGIVLIFPGIIINLASIVLNAIPGLSLILPSRTKGIGIFTILFILWVNRKIRKKKKFAPIVKVICYVSAIGTLISIIMNPISIFYNIYSAAQCVYYANVLNFMKRGLSKEQKEYLSTKKDEFKESAKSVAKQSAATAVGVATVVPKEMAAGAKMLGDKIANRSNEDFARAYETPEVETGRQLSLNDLNGGEDTTYVE